MKKQTGSKPAAPDQEKERQMPLSVGNYRLMLAGLALIVIGFLLMMGGRNPDADTFNYEMFSFRRITLAPIIVLAGFGLEIYAIMKKFRK